MYLQGSSFQDSIQIGHLADLDCKWTNGDTNTLFDESNTYEERLRGKLLLLLYSEAELSGYDNIQHGTRLVTVRIATSRHLLGVRPHGTGTLGCVCPGKCTNRPGRSDHEK